MKKQLRKQQFKSLLLAALAFMPLGASAQTYPIAIDKTNFPDENFRSYLLEQDYGKDGVLTKEEIGEIEGIWVSKRNIGSLKGIEYFTALTNLYCANNQLTTIDVSSCTDLYDFQCNGNQLSSLDLSKNVRLSNLHCENNQLTSLIVAESGALKSLYCYRNMLRRAALDNLIRSLPHVKDSPIYMYDDRYHDEGNVCTKEQSAAAREKGWGTLYYGSDVYGPGWIPSGGSGDVSINERTFPDKRFRDLLRKRSYGKDGIITESELAGIKTIDFLSLNSIESLQGIEFFTALKTLQCNSNKLTTLDVSQNTNLTTLRCGSNRLTALDVSQNTNLTTLNCNSNRLTTLDVSQNTNLTTLSCSSNRLTALDVSQNTNLITLSCGSNRLTALDVSQNTNLTTLNCSSNELTTLDVSNDTTLTSLNCNANRITVLDLSKNEELIELYCYNNMIKGAAMDALIDSLPTNTTDEYCHFVVYSTGDDERNVCTKSQVAAAKEKGWSVEYYDMETGWTYEYEGSDDSVGILLPTIDGIDENTPIYDLSGQRVNNLQGKKGVYIVGGKKVLVK